MNRHILALLLLFTPCAAQQFVHLDAQVHSPSSALSIQLAAGCWRITPVGPSAGGQYEAWHAWNGNNASCDAQGLNCSRGWATLYYVSSPIGGGQFGGTGFTATPGLALANSTSATYYLAQASTVNFSVADHSLNDNLGGLSLRLDAIPGCGNPATLATYGVGSNGVNGVPDLSANTLPTLGESSFAVQLSNAANNTLLVWLVGYGQGNVPLPDFGATLLVLPLAVTLTGATNTQGESTLPIALPCDPALLCGARLTCQAAVLDAAATGDFAFSNGVDFTIGS